jgi:hypothetical protein
MMQKLEFHEKNIMFKAMKLVDEESPFQISIIGKWRKIIKYLIPKFEKAFSKRNRLKILSLLPFIPFPYPFWVTFLYATQINTMNYDYYDQDNDLIFKFYGEEG